MMSVSVKVISTYSGFTALVTVGLKIRWLYFVWAPPTTSLTKPATGFYR